MSAILILERMFQAQSSFGTDKIAMERAKEKIGEIGWAYIQTCGGWHSFWMRCQTDVTSNRDLEVDIERNDLTSDVDEVP